MSAALEVRDAVSLSDRGHTTETGLELRDDLTFDEWATVGHSLGRAARASAWWIGDWINYGAAHWGEKYEEAQEITGLAYNTLRQYAKIAERFSIRHRMSNLTFGHHALVAPIKNVEERGAILLTAAEKAWGREELREHLAPQQRLQISPRKRHGALISAVANLNKIAVRWQRDMTDELTPPQARQQLTQIRKAQELLAAVAEAVEYRAATLKTFDGR